MLCEYLGKRLDFDIGIQQERQYERDGKPMAMVRIEYAKPKFCIDGLKNEQNVFFKEYENPAALFNHSFKNANCALARINNHRSKNSLRVYIKTTRDILPHEELTWTYGDLRSDLEEWFYN